MKIKTIAKLKKEIQFDIESERKMLLDAIENENYEEAVNSQKTINVFEYVLDLIDGKIG